MMTMTSRARVQRGHETETAVAAYLRENGWPHAEPVGAGRPGSDITGVPGLCVEVKARRDLRLVQWLHQANGTKDVGLVVHRPDGMGLLSVEWWPVTFRLKDAVTLLRDAGYGDEVQ